MPNGGDLEKCALARKFFVPIEEVLRVFAEENTFEFIRWYHDLPLFILQKPKGTGRGFMGPVHRIQLSIEPGDEEEAFVEIFAVSFSDKDGRRIKSVFVVEGKLPQDQERIPAWLKVAMSVCEAVAESDLLTVASREELNKRLGPVFGSNP